MLALQMSPHGYHWPVARNLLENAVIQVLVVGLSQGSEKTRVLRGGLWAFGVSPRSERQGLASPRCVKKKFCA
jgi:hypothetical protein